MADGTATRTFSIKVKGAAQAVPCAETTKVLTAIEQVFTDPRLRPVRVGCRQGGCGACRIKVTSGDFTTGQISRAHVTEEEQAQGYTLACRTFPQSDLEIESAFLGPRARQEKQDN